MGFLNIAQAFSPQEFHDFLSHQPLDQGFVPSLVICHNTASPTLKDRPNGFSAGNMIDLRAYYANVQKWSAGPHLFVDRNKIWVFCDLEHRGVHSPSFNGISWGVEMLGDYAVEAFDSVPGSVVRDNAVSAFASMFCRLGLDPDDAHFKLHREDPKTTHACPGTNVHKADMQVRIRARMAELKQSARGLPTKIVIYRKGGGQSPSAVLDGSIRGGVNYALDSDLERACGLHDTGIPVTKPVRPIVEERYDLKWDAVNAKLYLFER